MTTEILTFSPLRDFLARKKGAKKLLTSNVDAANKCHTAIIADAEALANLEIKTANGVRRAGDALWRIAEGLAQGDLTLDFQNQINAIVPRPLKMAPEMAAIYQRVSRKWPDEIKTIAEAHEVRLEMKQLLNAMWGLAEGRVKEQIAAPPRDAWGSLLSLLDKPVETELWPALQKDENYFPNGHLRQDLRELYADDLLPKVRARRKFYEELEKELDRGLGE